MTVTLRDNCKICYTQLSTYTEPHRVIHTHTLRYIETPHSLSSWSVSLGADHTCFTQIRCDETRCSVLFDPSATRIDPSDALTTPRGALVCGTV
ncbi:hypothetical protein PoB_003626900 [Plakobranchus ocellatus]|uniref:C2H2-type domain-containing protein n=1 Tax=Plakobranchus ocellatus TaxID=259542 RepID=A0AAV4AUI7_9GAST|nr:hypothetical protein PoB_003626900 [Plakobranchus ocellatus]